MGYGQLHQLIEQSKWEGVLDSLRNDPSLLSDAKEPHRDVLPLHMACEKRAPDEVILEILRCYPEAAKWKGRGGNLPLHVATHRNLSRDVIESIIREYPEALDEVNKANFTPRSIGHSDVISSQSLRRPTMCWHQLMHDEVLERQHAAQLRALHETVDAALKELKIGGDNMEILLARLECADSRMKDLEQSQTENDPASRVHTLQTASHEKFDRINNRVTTVDDDIKAAYAREFMAKAASRAQQSNVLRKQKQAAEHLKSLRLEVESVKLKFTTKL